MADLMQAVHGAVYDRLAAGVTLAPVYSVVPDNTQPPVVVLGDGTFEQIGGKNSNMERHELIVRTIIGGTSKQALLALMQEVKAALHNQPLTSPDAALARCVLSSGNELRDIDKGVLVGEQRFFVFASPL
jgi:hypothetical protein